MPDEVKAGLVLPVSPMELLAPAEKEPVPADRVRDAIRGMPPKSLPAVLAVDVLAIVEAVPDEKQTEVALALAKGAAAAVRGLLPSQAGEVIVHCQAIDLARLLEAAGVNAQ